MSAASTMNAALIGAGRDVVLQPPSSSVADASGVVPLSVPAFPFSQQFFPDAYIPSLTFYMFAPTVGGFSTFAMPSIPPGWQGKVLFQSLAFGSSSNIELSTPTVIDVQ
jgi:hypothetical protein